ncbi:HTH_48 domain-containing protein [Trichonephila clavipes]|nr:HTH_48 domain-containing protein [Trichonephila clavipes]
MSDGMVRKWVRVFKDGRTNIHDEERSGRPSVITDELIQKVDCKVKENRRFTISSYLKSFLLSQEMFFTKLCPNV